MDDVPIRIGELARRTGVSVDTIRHYERLGLLPTPARTRAGYRQYSPSIVNRVQVVRHGLLFGFSLRQLSTFLQIRQQGGTPCRDVRAAAGRILAAVDAQMADMARARSSMRTILKDWDRRLSRTAADQPARLLESLNAAAGIPARSSRVHLKTTRRHAVRP